MKNTKPAYLVLQDGTVFEGTGFGASGIREGEVVFNTAMTGYQEILTDPSYAGQIVVMTYPQIGNYGISPDDNESEKIFASGLIIKELSPIVSNYRSKKSVGDFLKQSKIPGIQGVDTRALVKVLRDKGAMPAVIAVGSNHKVLDLIAKIFYPNSLNQVEKVYQ